MAIRFETTAEALKQGYVPASQRVIERHNGGEIVIAEVAGDESLGPYFTVRAYGLNDARLGDFGASVTVWTNDENELGEPGSFQEMFSQDVFDSAITAARAAIDAHA